jgi:hypothetical protein
VRAQARAVRAAHGGAGIGLAVVEWLGGGCFAGGGRTDLAGWHPARVPAVGQM